MQERREKNLDAIPVNAHSPTDEDALKIQSIFEDYFIHRYFSSKDGYSVYRYIIEMQEEMREKEKENVNDPLIDKYNLLSLMTIFRTISTPKDPLPFLSRNPFIAQGDTYYRFDFKNKKLISLLLEIIRKMGDREKELNIKDNISSYFIVLNMPSKNPNDKKISVEEKSTNEKLIKTKIKILSEQYNKKTFLLYAGSNSNNLHVYFVFEGMLMKEKINILDPNKIWQLIAKNQLIKGVMFLLSSEKLTDDVTDFIGVSLYLPIMETEFTPISEVMKQAKISEYSVIDVPFIDNDPYLRGIKIVKICRDKNEFSNFTEVQASNPLHRLTSLGVMTSFRDLSIAIAISGYDYVHQEVINYIDDNVIEMSSIVKPIAKRMLKRCPTSIVELKNHELMKKLKTLATLNSDIQKLAEGIYHLIKNLPEDIEAVYIIQRLFLFLKTALRGFHGNTHTGLANYASLIMHEISLLIVKYNIEKKQSIVSYEAFKNHVQNHEANIFNFPKSTEHALFSLFHSSGSNASFFADQVALELAKKMGILGTKYIESGFQEYFEADTPYNDHLLYPETKENKNPNKDLENSVDDESEDDENEKYQTPQTSVVRVCLGPVGDIIKGEFPGININQYILHLLEYNKNFKLLIVDITSALDEEMFIKENVLNLLKDKASVVYWKSSSKLDQIHTEMALTGRTWLYLKRSDFDPNFLENLERFAEKSRYKPDSEISHYINSCCYVLQTNIRKRHFQNGSDFRFFALKGEKNMNLNYSTRYQELDLKNYKSLFIHLPDYFSWVMVIELNDFLSHLCPRRAGFGHRQLTAFDRIAIGAENPEDNKIKAKAFYIYKEIYNNTHSSKLTKENIYSFLLMVSRHSLCALAKQSYNEKNLIKYFYSVFSINEGDLFIPIFTINEETEKLEINRNYLINFLSCIKIFSVIDMDSIINPLSYIDILLFTQFILKNEGKLFHLRTEILNNSRDFLVDIYKLFDKISPFITELEPKCEDLQKKEQLNEMFYLLKEKFCKTGRIDLEDAIKEEINPKWQDDCFKQLSKIPFFLELEKRKRFFKILFEPASDLAPKQRKLN